MSKLYNVYIIVPTDNCVDEIDRLYESVCRQTCGTDRIRLLFADNCSDDGTYEKIIEYVSEHPEWISVLRMKEKTKATRVMREVYNFLRYTIVEFSMILRPGTYLYPDFIEKTINLIYMANLEFVAVNVDVYDEKGIKTQNPIFKNDCIIDEKYNFSSLFKFGIGSRILLIGSGLRISVPNGILLYFERIKYSNYWSELSYLSPRNFGYLTKPLAKVRRIEEEAFVDELMDMYLCVKAQTFDSELNQSKRDRIKMTGGEIETAYIGLSMMALQNAISAGIKGKYEITRQCLLIAEMIYLPIADGTIFQDILKAYTEKSGFEGLSGYLEVGSAEIPREYKQF